MIGRLAEFWRMLNLHCDEVARLASASLDRDLTSGERWALQTHIVYCRACRLYLAQIRRIREAVRHLDSLPPRLDERLPDEVRDRIKKALGGG